MIRPPSLRPLFWFALVLPGGCLKYEDGMAQQGKLACKLRDACGTLEVVGYSAVSDCIADATEQDWQDCPDYSQELMQTCVDAWKAAVDAEDCSLLENPPDACAQACSG